MGMVRRLLLVAGVLLLGLTPLIGQTADLHKIAGQVDKRYNSLQSLQLDFTETYKGAGISRSESGVMSLKKPGRMRWDYETPTRKAFLTDGKTAWFYVPGERQARRTSVKKLDDFRSPLRYLLGKTKLEKEFDNLAVLTGDKDAAPGDVVLQGIPRGMEDRVQSTRLEIAPDGAIVRIWIEELDGSITEFRFSNEKHNPHLADAKFKFKPPVGVEVIESENLEP
ncbi:MAG TPA: outer membrane lipoprotein chaperone LolA [Terriglobales bacterium]